MRHASEEIFFSLMSEAGFATTDTIPFPLPGEDLVGKETVFVHLYRYETSDHMTEIALNSPCIDFSR